jgi:hypothetical protein
LDSCPLALGFVGKMSGIMEKKNLLVFAIALLGIVGWMVAIYSFYVKEEAVVELPHP